MADSKISALTDGGNLQGADQVAINRGGTSYRAVALQDGWIDDTAETWTYASGSGGGTATFTVTGDVTAKYTVGTRIKLTQTTVKYFTVIAVSVASGTTTVTITAGTDYTLANAAISVNYHSYAANPQGYPGWFNWLPVYTGFTGAVTTSLAKFAIVGRILTINFGFNGTSNATTLTFTSPVPTVSSSIVPVQVRDNTVTQAAAGSVLSAGGGSTTITGRIIMSGGNWTNSGNKGMGGVAAFDI